MSGDEKVTLWLRMEALADSDGMVETALSDDPSEGNVRVPWQYAYRVELSRREREETRCAKACDGGGG